MKKVLIIGVNGFVGTHLHNELINYGYICYGADLDINNKRYENIEFSKIDILDKELVKKTLGEIKPDFIINLAAVSSVKLSWSIPQKTFDVNVNGAINILESIRELELKTRLLLIGSSEQYGKIDYSKSVSEDMELKALNPYGISKATQEKVARMYVEAYGLDVIMVRAFNHIGPGQDTGFVIPDFATQLIEIENGKLEPKLFVGNLEAERDFTDVRDVVRAYRLILENGKCGEVYNVGSGKAISIRSILDILMKICNVSIEVNIDKEKLRKIDTPKIECNNSKLISQTGWKPNFKIEDSLKDIMEFYRSKYSN